MTKQAWMVICVFVVALGSGMLLGMGVARAPQAARGGSWIETELHLTAPQREQMRDIWQGVVKSTGQHAWDQRRALSKEREEAVEALLTPEQKKQYDALQKKYNDELAALSQQREATYNHAVEQTRAMLTPQQAKRYDEILAKGFHGPRRGAASRPSETRP